MVGCDMWFDRHGSLFKLPGAPEDRQLPEV